AGQPERGERCTIHRARWERWSDIGYSFEVVANRFLHRMVRYIVGTVIDVARGRRPLGDVGDLLRGSPGMETSPPAPARGLFLSRVYYSAAEIEQNEPLGAEIPR